MKRTTITIIGWILVFGVYAQSNEPSTNSKDQKDIMQAIQNGIQGWEQKDVELATKDYAEDADWTNAFGDRYQGKQKLEEYIQFLFTLPTVMAGKTNYKYHDLKFIGSKVALVRSKSIRLGQQLDDGNPHGDRHINHLRVFEKREGKWLIVSHLISQELQDSKR